MPSAKKPGAPIPSIDKARHEKEIERAENVAAGCRRQGMPPADRQTHEHVQKGDFREPDLETPAEVEGSAL